MKIKAKRGHPSLLRSSINRKSKKRFSRGQRSLLKMEQNNFKEDTLTCFTAHWSENRKKHLSTGHPSPLCCSLNRKSNTKVQRGHPSQLCRSLKQIKLKKSEGSHWLEKLNETSFKRTPYPAMPLIEAKTKQKCKEDILACFAAHWSKTC